MKKANGEAGAVIIGVIAAAVFIGIVTAAMLKNTASLSAASRGYSSLQIMSSTARSGMIATESWFSNPANAEQSLEFLNGAIADPARKPYIFGGDDGKNKQKLADYQFFNSRLVGFDKAKMTGRFEINSGRSANGKNLKKACAFYRMGNVKIESGGAYGGKNAIYMKGSLVNGDNGMEVFGGATFEGSAKFQNSPGIFHGDAFFNENVEFMHWQNKFYGKTYIGGNATFQNIPNTGLSVFENDVGFNQNLSNGGAGVIVTAGNVYIRGDFRTPYNVEKNLELKCTAPQKHFYHTDNLTYYNPPPNGQDAGPEHCVPNAWSCVKHPVGHIEFNKVSGFASKTKLPEMTSASILQSLEMKDIDERRDPQLDISKIDQSLVHSAYDAATNGSIFSVNKLHESYDKAAEEGRLYKDHLVLKVGRYDPVINFNEPHNGKFDKKVIFIVEDGAALNPGGRFYHCTDNSSTLIYAGQGNAKLEQMGSGGLFRGLIYVDSLNTAHNSFNWKDGSSIEGAVHVFSDRNFQWNSGSNRSTKITFDEAVLNAFGSLVKGAAAGGGEYADFIDQTDRRVRMKQIGCYYY